MKTLRIHQRAIAIPTAIMMLLMVLPYGAAQAAMISTEQATQAPAATRTGPEARTYVMGILTRADVQAEMRTLGVNPEEAIARVNAMSDAEVQQVAGRIDSSPAGAGHGLILGIVGAVVLVFLILLLTDILCLTSVFPFTKCSVQGKSK